MNLDQKTVQVRAGGPQDPWNTLSGDAFDVLDYVLGWGPLTEEDMKAHWQGEGQFKSPHSELHSHKTNPRSRLWAAIMDEIRNFPHAKQDEQGRWFVTREED